MFHVKRGRADLYSTCPSLEPRRGSGINVIGPLIAVLVGIVHASIAPVVVVGGVRPNLVLVAVVLVTVVVGFLPGITWAFLGGLTANLLVGAPLGSFPLAMLVVAAFVAGGGRAFGRATVPYAVVAALVGSVIADLLTLALGALVGNAPIGAIPAERIVGAALLNAALCGLLVYPARALGQRYVPDEAPAW